MPDNHVHGENPIDGAPANQTSTRRVRISELAYAVAIVIGFLLGADQLELCAHPNTAIRMAKVAGELLTAEFSETSLEDLGRVFTQLRSAAF